VLIMHANDITFQLFKGERGDIEPINAMNETN
jgi:hypothetical protein